MHTADRTDRVTPAAEYRQVVRALAQRAARMGSRDPEAAAQEAIRRSVTNPASRPAIEYYFRDEIAPDAGPPEWSLAQLLGWLHGVLRFVIWEDRARASSQRELPAAIEELIDLPDRMPTALDAVIDAELRALVRECAMRIGEERRAALLLRLDGAKYDEIARRLGTNENTIATWLSRGSREVVELVRERMDRRPAPTRPAPSAVAKVSHA